MISSISYTKPSSNQHLRQILELQKINLASSIDQQTFKSQGFVTVQHDLKLLQAMNDQQAHAIALYQDKVIGYALSMTVCFSNHLPVLVPMFNMISSLKYLDKPMLEYKYFIMGQVCIAANFRSSGVFQGLYQQLKNENADQYDFIITEIDQRNTRSIAAHKKVGFKLLHQYSVPSNGNQARINWDLVLWDWS